MYIVISGSPVRPWVGRTFFRGKDSLLYGGRASRIAAFKGPELELDTWHTNLTRRIRGSRCPLSGPVPPRPVPAERTSATQTSAPLSGPVPP